MIKITAAAFVLFLSLAAGACGQTATYSWQDEFCEFKGVYDPGKLSRRQIEDTRKLIIFGGGLPLQTEHTAWTIKDIDKLDVKALDNEYRETEKMLRGLQLADTDYFASLRQKRLRTLKRAYELARITLLAHKDPQVLREYKGSDKCFENYGKPLIAGGDTLLAAWKSVNEAQRKENASPEDVKRRFEARLSSPERLSYALLDVMKFGWWNCINRSIDYGEDERRQAGEFRKLFVTFTAGECDEP